MDLLMNSNRNVKNPWAIILDLSADLHLGLSDVPFGLVVVSYYHLVGGTENRTEKGPHKYVYFSYTITSIIIVMAYILKNMLYINH